MTLVRCQLFIADDRRSLGRRAAELFAEAARESTRKRGRCVVLLSGGETPLECYRLLAQKPLRNGVPWHALQIFWGDERFVPQSDPRNNASSARRALLDHVPLSDSQIHPIPTTGSPREAALRYEQTIRSVLGELPRFDLTFLGMGENGHTASLFPETPVLDENERWVAEVGAEGDLERITLTAPAINGSRLVVFLAAGAAKAGVLREVLEGEYDPQRLPAQLIRPVKGRTVWMVDREAAQLLRLQEGEITYGTKR